MFNRLLTIFISLILTITLYKLPIFNYIDLFLYRSLFVLRGQRDWSQDIVVIEIDDKSISKLGRWPWSRSYQTRLINKLSLHEPSILIYDILMSEFSPQDKLLAKAINNCCPVILPVGIDRENNVLRPVNTLSSSAIDLGHVLVKNKQGLVIDKVKPIISIKNRSYTQLSILGYNYYQLLEGNSLFTIENNRSIWINWPGEVNNIQSYSFYDVLFEDIESDKFRDKIVFIGLTATGFDTTTTPYESEVAGMFLHVAILSNLLQDRTLYSIDSLLVDILKILIPFFIFMGIYKLPHLVLQLSMFLVGLGLILGLSLIYIELLFLWLSPTLSVISFISCGVSHSVYDKIRSTLYAASLEDEAYKDGLTNIANRRRFDRDIDYLWENSIKYKEPLSLLLMDIDHFKLYNDNYGHAMGDECLKEVASILANSIRPTDKVARYGGEEFVVLLPNTNKEQAFIVGNRILINIRKRAIEHKYSKVANIITLSIGVSTNSPPQFSYKELIEDADKGLYHIKESTRNGLSFHNSLIINN